MIARFATLTTVPFLLLVVLGTGPSIGWARSVDPYSGQVPVADSSEASLQAAFEAALVQVMQKVTGAQDSVQDLLGQGSLGDARAMVLQHGFVESPLLQNPELRMLRVRFSPGQVNQRVRELGLPFWPPERPETIVWVALQRDSQRQLLGVAAEDEPLLRLLTAAGEFHAVPLVLPLMDLEDQQAISVSEVWGGLQEPVARASQRYGATQILMGRMFPRAGDAWTIRWTLFGDRYNEGWNSSGDTAAAALTGGIAEMSRRMGRRFALRATGDAADRRLMLRIRGMADAAVYGRVMRYLNDLSVVAGAEPMRASGDTLDVWLNATTGVRGLVQVMETGGVLRILDGAREPGVDLLVEPDG